MVIVIFIFFKLLEILKWRNCKKEVNKYVGNMDYYKIIIKIGLKLVV